MPRAPPRSRLPARRTGPIDPGGLYPRTGYRASSGRSRSSLRPSPTRPEVESILQLPVAVLGIWRRPSAAVTKCRVCAGPGLHRSDHLHHLHLLHGLPRTPRVIEETRTRAAVLARGLAPNRSSRLRGSYGLALDVGPQSRHAAIPGFTPRLRRLARSRDRLLSGRRGTLGSRGETCQRLRSFSQGCGWTG